MSELLQGAAQTRFTQLRRRLVHALRRRIDPESQNPFLTFARPGHFYSPIPSRYDVERATARASNRPRRSVPGVELRESEQRAFVTRAIERVGPLPIGRDPTNRYTLSNEFFQYADAWMTYAMLREFVPKRIIEVGSGFSSAVMLDVSDAFFDTPPCFTFIEPYPDRLSALLTEGDRSRCEIIPRIVQDVGEEMFGSLERNDILFIDSSHVVKAGSDVNLLFLEIIPSLRPGVLVHVHDILWDFEYPQHWFRQGRAWSEAYLLRAFLQFNREFEVLAFNSFLAKHATDLFAKSLPGFLENPGGSLWFRRVAPRDA